MRGPRHHGTTAADADVGAVSAASFPPDSVFGDGHPLPQLFVFDLDYTLWPFWVDTHVTPPVKAGASAPTPAVVDRYGDSYAFFPEVPRILQMLPQAGVQMAVASRTSAPELAREFLSILQVPAGDGTHTRALDVFGGRLEIYPTNKLQHMAALKKQTGIAYDNFLFFDDESRNRNVESVGVTMRLVKGALTAQFVEDGVRAWRRKHGHPGGGDGPVPKPKARRKGLGKYDDSDDEQYY